MAVLASEFFENGTLGAAVQEADTIFSNVDNGITYVAGLGGSSLACNVNPATIGACRNSGFTPMNKIVIRFLFKFATAPLTDVIIAHISSGDPNAGGTRIGHLYLTTDRRLVVRNIWTTVAISTMQFATNTEYALEWMFDGANQQQRVRLFTNTSSTATAAETIGPVGATSGATTANWVQVGKMTNTTWSGGLTFDRYRRANDWIAAPANTILWDLEWVGTAGNDIVLPAGWSKEGVNVALPKYKVGGPNVDQSYINFAGQTIGNRRLLSTQLPAGQHTYERFYVQMNGKPTIKEEHQVIWSAGSLDTRLFRLVVVGGVGSYYDLELWADGNWNPTLPDPEEGLPSNPDPIGVLHNFAIDTFHRIEIDITATTGPATCTVKAWKGTRRNSDAAPDETISGACIGTTSLRYRRFEQFLHSSVINSITHRGLAFDGMVISQDGLPIGPLPLEEQYDPPLVSQWTFSEWTGTEERQLSLAGASTGGANLEEVNVGDPGDPGDPGDGLFTADPGLGSKLYVSADSNASPRYNAVADLYNFEMRTLSAGAGHPASNRCAPGCYRSFYGHAGGINAHPSFSTHGATSWDDERKAVANTAISSWSYDAFTAASAAEIFNGGHNTWMKEHLAPFIKDIYERYGHLYTFDLGNEPDAWSNSPNTAGVPLWHNNVRRAARYIHFFLKNECGVPEEAFMVTCATHTQQIAYGHVAAHARPVQLTGTSWTSGIRGDALYYYNPDWKGTRTVTDGYWSDAYDPNPIDFVQIGEMDQWGYGRGPVHRMTQFNFYEREYEYCQINTLAKFRSTVASLEGGSPRTGNLFKFTRALYGGMNPVLPVSTANIRGIPCFIGELGFGVWVPLPSAENAAVPKDTADAFCETIIPDLVEKCNVVAYAKWRYVVAGYNNTSLSNVDTYSHHYKVGAGGTHGTKLWDSTNANTKAEAAIFNTQYVADSPPWPNGTKRPPYVSINSGAKRDYRGINDVPQTDEPPPPPLPSNFNPALGCSDSPNNHGGSEDWDAWRSYRWNGAMDLASETGANHPKVIAITSSATDDGGLWTNYANALSTWTTRLEEFYYQNDGVTPHAVRSDVELHIANGNEYAKDVTDGNLSNFINGCRGIYDATRTLKLNGTRKFPLASSWLNPTNWFAYQTAIGSGLDVPLDISMYQAVPYLDGISWSMYPPGRESTVDDPTWDWPSFDETRMYAQSTSNSEKHQRGFLLSCFKMTRDAQRPITNQYITAFRPLKIACWEIGIGMNGLPTIDQTTRPYWATHIIASMEKLSDQYGLNMSEVIWWDQQLSDTRSANILSDEPAPGVGQISTRVAWQKWRTYNHWNHGSHPSAWPATPKTTWKNRNNTWMQEWVSEMNTWAASKGY